MSKRKKEQTTPKERSTREEKRRLQELRDVYAHLQKPENPAAPRMRRDGVRQG